MVACAFCGAEVEGNYAEVTGWQKRRPGKRAGGLHALLMRKETGRHACNECGFDITHGIIPKTQPRLDV